ncbi:hypothetical protein [Lysobacter sp. Root667]|uniref:hypothetical protein n=1 Tax=Lysobacter sp. Root667 TaxID=1736581 RepID=UPI000AF801AC|nr:hypothetical protein [Lysobacter sp. Root667]
MEYSIDDFWRKNFAGVERSPVAKPLDGWDVAVTSEPSYVQASLSLRDGFDDLTQKVWLVGAPGAVGKSTLAKEICAATGAVYLDLASAATVAGNYLVGGLVYANLLDAWTGGKVGIVIDALDEARLRVTQSGFEAFLTDVASAAAMGKFPVIVLGRVGIVEEAWTILNELGGIEPPIFDINLFNLAQAKKFVLARLQRLAMAEDAARNLLYPDLGRSLQTHGSVYEDVVDLTIDGLRQLSLQDEDRFVGYAPVLDAVSKVIASESNPSKLGGEMQRILGGQVLASLSSEILIREQGKLVSQLQNTFPKIPEGLYGPEEQLSRIGARLFGAKQPPLPPQLKPEQVASYEQAVNNLLPQHPFLDGSGTEPSSAVFAACVVAAALNGGREELISAAESYASSTKHTPNPFLYEFYSDITSAKSRMPAEHVGLIFESVLARAKPGETVHLNVEDNEEGDDLSVELVVDRGGESPSRIEFRVPSAGSLRFGRRVSGVFVTAERSSVELGVGDQLEFVAPVFIAAKRITLRCGHIVAKSDALSSDNTVILEAEELVASSALAAPIVRPGTQLQVNWPDAASYPWTQFASATKQDESPKTAEALRALRRLAMAFRSHSKGQLGRFRDKIDHQRMMKGEVGRALLQKLMKDRVISLQSTMYILDAGALGEKVGASYVSLKLKVYSEQTRKYVQDVI